MKLNGNFALPPISTLNIEEPKDYNIINMDVKLFFKPISWDFSNYLLNKMHKYGLLKRDGEHRWPRYRLP